MSMNYKKGIVPFQWEDPLFLDQQLTEEERMIRDAARDFCQGPADAAGTGSQPPRDFPPRNHE